MSSPMEKIQQAKQLLDMGVISQADFDVIKNQCLVEMGMAVSKPPIQEQQMVNQKQICLEQREPVELKFRMRKICLEKLEFEIPSKMVFQSNVITKW